MMTLFRDVATLQGRGATAVLVPVSSDHELVAAARGLNRPTLAGSRSRVGIPILLVDESASIDGAVEMMLPASIRAKTEIRNVIGVLRGSDPELADEAVMFSAHLDHLGIQPGQDDPIYNGADDDASGVTAVLSLADAFGALQDRPQRSVIFMTFWGEERGLLGSRHFAEHPLWPLKKIVANVNIEMIGRPEAGARNKVWKTGWERSNLGELMAVGATRVDTLVFAHPQYSGDMLYRASDNWSLAAQGVVAHSFSAGSLHDDYHQPTDDWQRLELDHMTAVIRGLFAGSLPIAKGEMTPAARSDK